jgi:hypothetical protein
MFDEGSNPRVLRHRKAMQAQLKVISKVAKVLQFTSCEITSRKGWVAEKGWAASPPSEEAPELVRGRVESELLTISVRHFRHSEYPAYKYVIMAVIHTIMAAIHTQYGTWRAYNS